MTQPKRLKLRLEPRDSLLVSWVVRTSFICFFSLDVFSCSISVQSLFALPYQPIRSSANEELSISVHINLSSGSSRKERM